MVIDGLLSDKSAPDLVVRKLSRKGQMCCWQLYIPFLRHQQAVKEAEYEYYEEGYYTFRSGVSRWSVAVLMQSALQTIREVHQPCSSTPGQC